MGQLAARGGACSRRGRAGRRSGRSPRRRARRPRRTPPPTAGRRRATPRRGSSARSLGLTALSAMPAAPTFAPSSQSAAPAAAIAQSPVRRLTFSYALPPCGADRDADLDEHLGVADRGLVRAAVEVGHVDRALAAAAADHGDGAERGADGAQVLGRVGLAERAADRAAVAHRRVGDLAARRRAMIGKWRASSVGLEQLAVPGERADPHLAALLADVVELGGERVDVDQVLGRREPQLHHRQQRVAAGDEPGLRARGAPAARGRRRRSTRARSRTAQVPAWASLSSAGRGPDATPAPAHFARAR